MPFTLGRAKIPSLQQGLDNLTPKYFLTNPNTLANEVFGSGGGKVLTKYQVLVATDVLQSGVSSNSGLQWFSPKLYNNIIKIK